MVKYLSLITLLKHILTLISLWGGVYASQIYPPWPEITIILTFHMPKDCLKIGEKLSLEPDLVQTGSLEASAEFLSLQVDWHTFQDWAHDPRLSRIGCCIEKVNQ